MRLTLTRKLVYSMALVALVLGLFLGVIEYSSLRYALNKRVNQEIEIVCERIAMILVSPVLNNAHEEIFNILQAEMWNPHIHEFALQLDPAAADDSPGVTVGRDRNWNPIRITLRQAKTRRVERIPIEHQGEIIAVADLHLTDRFIRNELKRYVFQTLLKVSVLILLFLLMLFHISKRFVCRLQEGIDMIENLARGRARHLEPPEENDEIADLIDSVNAAIDFFEGEEEKKLDMQKQMFHAAKLASIGELAAGVAHEINNPLMVIQGYADHLLEHCPHNETPECGGHLRTIGTACARISKIVQGLRIYARSEDEQAETAPFNVHMCIESCLELVGAIYFTWGINISPELAAGHPCVIGIESKLQQVFMNLLANARDALQQAHDKNIRIRTGNQDDRLRITISDTGCGIPEDILPKIYDPFFTTKPIGEGTGLGLGICYRIVQQMDGQMTVESEPGRGTSFTIDLPCVPCPPHLQQADPLPEAAAGHAGHIGQAVPPDIPRVLFVDDDPLLRDMFPLILSDTNLQVTVASSANEALRLLDETAFDIIIVDFCMPEINGVELIQLLIERKTPWRIIMLTGGVIDESARDIEHHLAGCLSKPLTRDALLDVINAALARPPSSPGAARNAEEEA